MTAAGFRIELLSYSKGRTGLAIIARVLAFIGDCELGNARA